MGIPEEVLALKRIKMILSDAHPAVYGRDALLLRESVFLKRPRQPWRALIRGPSSGEQMIDGRVAEAAAGGTRGPTAEKADVLAPHRDLRKLHKPRSPIWLRRTTSVAASHREIICRLVRRICFIRHSRVAAHCLQRFEEFAVIRAPDAQRDR